MKFLHFIYMFTFCSFGWVSLQAQCTTPRSFHVEDQHEQGPCYVFATIAAIEATANQQINLSEWYMFSECVMGKTSEGNHTIKEIVAHTNSQGALFQQDFYNPFGPGGNGCISSNGTNNQDLDCMFFCYDESDEYDGERGENFCNETVDDCPIGMVVNDVGEENIGCSYQGYTFYAKKPASYILGDLTLTSLEFADKTDQEKEEILESQLCGSNQGVVLFLDTYSPNADPGRAHGIFVFGKDGATLKFKDSWPSDPSSNRQVDIPRALMTEAYIVTGSVSEVSCSTDPEPVCDCELEGPTIRNGQATFQLIGPCRGREAWELSENLTIVSGGKSRYLTVELDDCDPAQASVSISTERCPELSIDFTLNPRPVTPTEIQVFAKAICPNQLVEINVYDANGTYPTTGYEWEVISGGSISSGQGSPVIFVQTSSPPLSTLIVRVRAVNDCGESAYREIRIPFSRNCKGGGSEGGGGQYKTSINNVGHQNVAIFPNPSSTTIQILGSSNFSKVEILSLSGTQVIESYEDHIDISQLNPGIYFVKVSSDGIPDQVMKLVKK